MNVRARAHLHNVAEALAAGSSTRAQANVSVRVAIKHRRACPMGTHAAEQRMIVLAGAQGALRA